MMYINVTKIFSTNIVFFQLIVSEYQTRITMTTISIYHKDSHIISLSGRPNLRFVMIFRSVIMST